MADRVPSDRYLLGWMSEATEAQQALQTLFGSRLLPPELRQALSEWSRRLRTQKQETRELILDRMACVPDGTGADLTKIAGGD